MDWFSLSLVLALGALFAVTFIMVSVSVVGNLRGGQSHRESLEQRVNGLRFGRMIQRLGLSSSRYVHKVPVVAVEQQLQRCSGCEHTARCDTELEQPIDVVPEYCANASDLSGTRRLVAEAA